MQISLKNKMKRAQEAGLDGVNLSHKIIDEEVMENAASQNLEVYTWTVDEPAEAQRLMRLGVKGITTNRPKWLKDQLNDL